MSSSRRDFLKFAALLSGATGISGFVPESIQRAFAIEPEPGSTFADAEHIVILMQENRSFDHAFGTLQGVRGFNDPRALRLPNGNSAFVQTSASTGESYAPWRLDLRAGVNLRSEGWRRTSAVVSDCPIQQRTFRDRSACTKRVLSLLCRFS